VRKLSFVGGGAGIGEDASLRPGKNRRGDGNRGEDTLACLRTRREREENSWKSPGRTRADGRPGLILQSRWGNKSYKNWSIEAESQDAAGSECGDVKPSWEGCVERAKSNGREAGARLRTSEGLCGLRQRPEGMAKRGGT